MPIADPIRCYGRRYPSAPPQALLGCIERPPPYYFALEGSPSDDYDPDFEGSFLAHWVGWTPSVGWNPRQNWWWLVDVPSTTPNINIFTSAVAGGQVRIDAEFYLDEPFNIQHRIRYGKVVTGGFQPWGVDIVLPFSSVNNWSYDTWPSSVTLWVPTYDQLPAGVCILP